MWLRRQIAGIAFRRLHSPTYDRILLAWLKRDRSGNSP